MKINDFNKIIPLNKLEIEIKKPLSEIIEEDTKSFLRSKKGLQYLRMRYPGYTFQEAVREYKHNAYVGLNF